MRHFILCLILLLPCSAFSEGTKDGFDPIASFLGLLAGGVDAIASRVENTDPQELRDNILEWNEQLGQLDSLLEFMEGYFPEVKPHSDAIQDHLTRLKRFSEERNLQRIEQERQILVTHLRELAQFLRVEADRIQKEEKGSDWYEWLQSIWKWLFAEYSASCPHPKPTVSIS